MGSVEQITWFGVAEKLPDDDEAVLVLRASKYSDYFDIASIEGGRWYSSDGSMIDDRGPVTHWAKTKGPV